MKTRSYKLKSCVWEITLKCCFSCKYCGSKAGRERINELTTTECLSVADQLSDLGCERVSLIGGEVFMRDDWDMIAESLHKNGIRTSIITNGYYMSESLIQKIKDAGVDSIAVSIDSIEPVHDKYRQKGSFLRAMNTVGQLAGSDIPVAVISTLNSENSLYLEELYNVLKTIPLYTWQIQACNPMGNATCGIDYRFDFERVMNFVYEKVFVSPFPIGVSDNIGYFKDGEGYIRGRKNGLAVFQGCRAGLTSIGIDSCGNVKGCEALYDESFIEGNLRNDSLSSIWNDPDSFSYNRHFSNNMLSGGCAECRYGEICQGGCRAYNFFVHKKLYDSPFCPNNLQ